MLARLTHEILGNLAGRGLCGFLRVPGVSEVSEALRGEIMLLRTELGAVYSDEESKLHTRMRSCLPCIKSQILGLG